MDVLLDIVKFLKILRSGQFEIEAGQFKLYEGMESMNQAIDELKSIKKDVDYMKTSNAEQMGLIKELQVKLDELRQNYEKGQSAIQPPQSSTEYIDIFNDPIENKQLGKGDKRKICGRIEEVVDITSEVSVDEFDSDEDTSFFSRQYCSQKNAQYRYSGKEENSERDSLKQNSVGKQTVPCHEPCNSNEILQRYLNDSAKYIDRKGSTEIMYKNNNGNIERESSPSTRDPFGNDTSSQMPVHSEPNKRYNDVNKVLPNKQKSKRRINPKSFGCCVCSKKFSKMADYIRHKKKHKKSKSVIDCRTNIDSSRGKERLKQHVVARLKNFKGFRCCYCQKVCSSPEKLTAHLRQCRIITKNSSNKK